MIQRPMIRFQVAQSVILLVLNCPYAGAQQVAVDFSIPSGQRLFFNGAGYNALGWRFSADTPIAVSGIGLFDYGFDGFNASYEVTIWGWVGAIRGVPLLSALVNNDSEVVPSQSTFGEWRFTGIESSRLDPGEYVIGVYFPQNDPTDRGALDFVDNSGRIVPTVSKGISYKGYAASNSGAFPFHFIHPTDTGFFGPNLTFVIVPEPASSVLLLLSAGALDSVVRKR